MRGGRAPTRDVIALKTTVYRTSDESPLVPALIEAAEEGKQSVCLVELKARFDERRNIEWSRALEQAGVHVVYGFPNLKIHAKTTLVVRREGDGLRRYVHIGTGQLPLGDGAALRGLRPLHRRRGHRRRRRRPLQLPDRLRPAAAVPQAARRAVRRCARGWSSEIRAVGKAAEAGKQARIRIKVNALTDPSDHRGALHGLAGRRAGRDRRARICMLRPGVPGMSENIRVRSVLGRFLEHSRVFVFEAATRRRSSSAAPT